MVEFLKASVIIIASLANLYLGFLVLQRNPQKGANRVFFALAFSFFAWGSTLLFYEFPMVGSRLLWIKLTYFIANGYVLSVLFFSFLFPKPGFTRAVPAALVTSFIHMVVWTYILFATKLWVAGVTESVGGHETMLGPAYLYWDLSIWAFTIWGVINFLKRGKSTSAIGRVQMTFFWVGFVVFGIVVNLMDVVIPIAWGTTKYFSLSVISSIFFSGAVAYIMLKHRFMDIRFMVARSIAYLFTIAFVGVLYVGGMFALLVFLSPGPLNIPSMVTSTVLTLAIALSFQPILRFFQKITVHIFYRDYYTIDEFLSSVSYVMATELQLNALMCGVLDIVHRYIHATCSTIIVHDKEYDYVIESSCATSLHMSMVSEDLAILKRDNKLLVYEEIDDGDQKDIMRKHDIGLFMPLATKQGTIGYLLLGPKASGDVYFSQDVKVFQIMAPELAVALENAQSYQKIKIFNETLKVEIAKATRDLRQANVHLKQLDHLKDEFISIASHELRTPLTTLKGFLELELKEPEKLSYDSRNHLERAYASSMRMISLVNDMLDVSRIESGKMTISLKPCDLEAGVREVVEEEEAHIKEKHATVDVVGNANISVLVDCTRMHQVLLNLLDNALKFIPDGGHVTITCSETEKEGSFAVSDNGPGIRKEDMPRLFTKFGKLGMSYASMSEAKGTGLGLYICKKLVELQHGKISVTSEIGKGSTFTVAIPKVKDLPSTKKSDTLNKEAHGT